MLEIQQTKSFFFFQGGITRDLTEILPEKTVTSIICFKPIPPAEAKFSLDYAECEVPCSLAQCSISEIINFKILLSSHSLLPFYLLASLSSLLSRSQILYSPFAHFITHPLLSWLYFSPQDQPRCGGHNSVCLPVTESFATLIFLCPAPQKLQCCIKMTSTISASTSSFRAWLGREQRIVIISATPC